MRIFVSFALGLISLSAMADCGKDSKQLFQCTTAKGKVIELCDSGKTIDYSFGKPREKPEIVVRAVRGDASTTQYEGIGRWESYSVDVPNGDTTYSVFWGVDKLSSNHTIEAGVNVETNGKQVAQVLCSPNGKVLHNLEGVKLKSGRQ
ncbi:MAG TPA: hypothetical protein PLK50_02420 [Ottowia sp.]|uniref:hypothetical protein n=1 Tax=Ottowia sp. TaxID=1898956 RepID=UPI002D1B281F|nr:hypothetical protein [Ottowia sp.]HPZ56154.1 hypothetical protein [Ottowia sp.]